MVRPVALPLKSPLMPQLARSAAEPAAGRRLGLRAQVGRLPRHRVRRRRRDRLQSRNGRDLTRYFPELRFAPGRYVLDGEIVVHGESGRQDFDLLGQRIHPAQSRVDALAEETPARFVAFDLLARDDDVLLELPYLERRAALEDARRRSRSS